MVTVATVPKIVVCFTFQKANGNDACMHLCRQLARVQHMTVGDSTPFLYSSMFKEKLAGVQQSKLHSLPSSCEHRLHTTKEALQT